MNIKGKGGLPGCQLGFIVVAGPHRNEDIILPKTGRANEKLEVPFASIAFIVDLVVITDLENWTRLLRNKTAM